jgi:hypothetical protein|tara:strand:+ start:1037 stop:1621 length:585 start_codon:yes stop_codon:yes gene_type:complete
MSKYTSIGGYKDSQLLDRVKGLDTFTHIPKGAWCVVLRSEEDISNTYDDKLYFFRGEKFQSVMTCTSNSGSHYLKNPLNSKGAAIIASDTINYDSHKRGLHRGRMEAFRQVKPIYMYRDNNKDSKVDEVGKRYLENAYTNIHTNSYSRKTGILTWIVGKFSAGCVVVNNLTKYYDMIYSVDKNEYVSLCILKEF